MKLTGKCKEDFEKWYTKPLREKVALHRSVEFFKTYTPSMQYGVYVDFFDSVDIDIDTKFCGYLKYDYSIKDKISHGLLFTEYDWSTTRQEARTKAIEKANEIYNL